MSETSSIEPVDTRQDMVDLVFSKWLTSGADDPNAVDFNEDESSCIAEFLVSEFGVARLQELGYDTETSDVPSFSDVDAGLSDDELARQNQGLRQCVDFQEKLASFLAKDESLSEQQADCVATALLETESAPTVNDLTEEQAEQAFIDAGRACGLRE